ncbi:hypothetical protein H5P28_17970 [Ruficoccus amylovorans]|uniref:Type II secretion system protein D n=1 Tax=Ruficoccus amylovorans TaxID=1804625 RepID=A0A842HIH3_9BACT|nr:secretin N-terminal domain-containing protein [Ruficoccus amylovorans]MBC2596159.1 hypothetical protein [Ruficoccus amylovorans]
MLKLKPHWFLLPLLFAWALAPASAQPAPAADTQAHDIICKPAEGISPDEMVGPIVMGNMPVLQALDLLSKFSGRVILPGEGLPSGRLNFNSGSKLKRTDAIFAIESLLALNGVSLRLLDNGFVRAISSANPDKSAPPMIDTLPENSMSEQIYTKIFKLKYADSRSAYNNVRGLLSDRRRSSMQNQSETNSLLITDSLINLQRIEKVLEYLDQPPDARMELYTFPVKYGSAWNIRTSLQQILRTEMKNRLNDSMVFVDSRTNKLLVVTHPTNLEFFETIVKDLDQEIAPFTTTEVIKITQGNFWSIWSTINGIVRHQQREFSRRGFSVQEREESDEVGRLSGGSETASVEAPAGGEESTELPALEMPTTASDPNAVMVEDTTPELQFSPYVGLYADPSNLAFVVYGTNNDIARIKQLIAQLDIKSPPYVTSKVFTIEHALAGDIRNVIEYTVNVQRRNFARAGLSTDNRTSSAGPEAAGQQSAEQGFEYSNFISTIADNRNNTILVQGTQQDIAQIGQLVEKLDVPSAPLTQNEVIYLKHAEASTLARVVQNIINYQRWMFSRQRTVSQSNNGDASALANPEIGFEFSNYAMVGADRRTNALFAYGTKQDLERIRSIVTETDIPVEPITTTRVFPLTHTDASQTASLINNIINGQRRALNQVRSESREVQNPAAREANAPADPTAAPSQGVIEGNEALQFSPFISITPDRRSNSLIVYGTASDIRQLDDLIKQIDIEVAPLTSSKVFLLENAQARSLYAVLNNVVRGQERALRQVRSSIQQIRNIHPDDPNASAAEVTLEALQFSPYITITPNDRNNSIIVYGTDSDITQLENLIEISDVQISPKTQSRTFFIRHADANEVASTISKLISQQQRVRERESTLTRIFRRGANGQDEGGEADGAIGMGQETFAGGGAGGGQGDLLTETSSATYSDIFSFDEDLQFSPYVSLVADDRSNAVLAYGTQFDLEQIGELIKQIDDVLPQVRIEVVIAEVILSDKQVSGLDSFGISYNVTAPNQTSMNTSAPAISSGNPAFEGSFSINDFSLDTVFRVAKENKFVKVLSAPSLTTTHNRQAVVNVGEARPIITSSASSLDSSDLVTRSTVEYRDIGINLKVRPLISTKGYIQMDIEQVVETVIDTQTIDGNEQPIISTRRAMSFLSVRDKEVIVMAGLQQVDSSKTDGSVFILGDLPVFGPLFQPENNDQAVRELIIFIKPYIVDSFDESQLLTSEELDRTAIGQDIATYLEKGRFKEQEKLIPPPPDPEEAEEDVANSRTQNTNTNTTTGPRR